jgi:hypothetical protein
MGLAMSAASTGAAYYGQRQAAEAQQDYQQRMYSETAKQAYEAYSQSVRQIANRTEQERAKMIDAATDNAIEGMSARATTAVAMGEAGVGGNTVEQLLLDFQRQESLNKMALERNFDWVTQQGEEEKKGAAAQAQARISGATPGPITMPSALAAGLTIAGQSLNTYDTIAYRNQWGGYRQLPKAT